MRKIKQNPNGRVPCKMLLNSAMAALLTLVASKAPADIFEWRNPVDGFYFTNTNWNNTTGVHPGPPGIGDVAHFNESGLYEVWFANDETGDSVEVSAGAVTFRSLGTDRTYSLSSTNVPFELEIPIGSLTLGVAGDPLDLELTSGVLVTDGVLNVNHGSALSAPGGTLIGQNGNGLLFVDGAGSTLTSQRVILGFGGNGAITSIFSGGQIETANPTPSSPDLLLGSSLTQIVGNGSTWTSNGMNVLESAALKVRNSGHMNVSNLLLSSAASTEVFDTGTINVTDGLQLGGAGRLEIYNSGAVSVANAMNLDGASSLDINGGDLTAGSLNIDGALDFHDGNVEVTNFASNGTFNHQGGFLRINGGTGSFDGTHAFGGGPATAPILRIQGGADVSYLDSWQIAMNPGEFASLIVVGTQGGSASRLRGISVGEAADLYVGGSGDGILLANFGGLVQPQDDVIVGADDGSRGQLTISNVENGVRSTVDATLGGSQGNVWIGGESGAGVGLLTIQGGGLLESGNNIYFAQTPGSEGYGTIGGNQDGYDAEMIAVQDIFLGGDANNAGGTSVLTINDGGRVLADEMIVWAGSQVNLEGGTLSLRRLDVNSHGGLVTFTNDSTYDVDIIDGDLDMDGGTITPGDSPGIMTVNGNYTTEATTLEIEIGGLTPGLEFDRVEVTGTAMIDGSLDVQLYDLGGGTFVPTAGDAFDIFSATGGITGAFGTVNTPTLPNGLSWAVNYGTNNVFLEVLSSLGDFNSDGVWDIADIDALVGAIAAMSSDQMYDMNGDGAVDLLDITADGDGWLAVGGSNNPLLTGGNPFLSGDANLDGLVDGLDFIDWNDNKFSAADGWSAGDFDANGIVDGLDFILWNANKFTSSSTVAVPEPTGTLLLMGLLSLTFGARRNKLVCA